MQDTNLINGVRFGVRVVFAVIALFRGEFSSTRVSDVRFEYPPEHS